MKRPILFWCVIAFAIAHVLALAPHPAEDPAPFKDDSSRVVAFAREQDLGASFGGEEAKKCSEFFTKAVSLYQKADFAGAAIYLERARRIDRENSEIEKILTQTRAKIQEQDKARKALPASSEKRAKFLAQYYSEAQRLLSRGDLETAYATFYQIWLMAGDYKDVPAHIKQIDADRAVAQSGAQGSSPAPRPQLASLSPNPEAQAPPASLAADRRSLSEPLAPAPGPAPQGSEDIEARRPEIEPQSRQPQAPARSKMEQEEKPSAERLQRAVAEALAAAQRYNSRGRRELAAAEYQRVLEMDPQSQEALDGLAQVEQAMRSAEADQAKKTLEEDRSRAQQEEARQKQVNLLLEEARSAMAQGDAPKADTYYSRALETDPGNRQAAAGLAQARGAAEQMRQAELQERQRRERVQAMLAEAAQRMAEEDFEGAQGDYQNILTIDPGNGEAAAGVAAAAAGKANKEETRLAAEREKIEAERQQFIAKLLDEARLEAAEGDLTQASLIYERILGLDARNPDAVAELDSVVRRQEAAVALAKVQRSQTTSPPPMPVRPPVAAAAATPSAPAGPAWAAPLPPAATPRAAPSADKAEPAAQGKPLIVQSAPIKVRAGSSDQGSGASAPPPNAQPAPSGEPTPATGGASPETQATGSKPAQSAANLAAPLGGIVYGPPSPSELAQAFTASAARESQTTPELRAPTKSVGPNEDRKTDSVLLPPKVESLGASLDQKPVDLAARRVEPLLAEARKNLEAGQNEAAGSLFDAVLGLDPKNEQAQQGKTRVQALRASPAPSSSEDLRQAEIRGLIEEAGSLLENLQYAEAEKAFQRVALVDPGNQEALRGLERLQAARASGRGKSAPAEAPGVPGDKGKGLAGSPASGLESMEVAALPDMAPAEGGAQSPAPVAEASKSEGMARADRANLLTREGEALAIEGRYEEALRKFEEAKTVASDDSLLLDVHISQVQEAMRQRSPREVAQAAPAPSPQAPAPSPSLGSVAASDAKAQREQLDKLHEEGFRRYEAGDLRAAREKMEEALRVDPSYEPAKTFLESTAEEWQRQLGDESVVAEAASREEAGLAKLKEGITIETKTAIPLADFMSDLSLPTGINFTVADGIDIKVNAKFVDEPLEHILETILTPNGLKWERQKGNIIVITPDLHTQTFNLTGDNIGAVKALLDSGQLSKMLWTPDGAPKLKGQEITLDERANILMATDSQQNLTKLDNLLKSLEAIGPQELVTRFYEVPPDKSERIKGLLEAVLGTSGVTPYDLERKIRVDQGTLIVHATPSDIAKIEELLQQEEFMGRIFSRDLQLQTFTLIPREALRQNDELAKIFFDHVKEQIETFLYRKTGMIQAAQEGRKMWPERDLLQITLTDYPENLAAIGDFINSLDQLERQTLFKVIYLKYAVSEDMETELRSFFGLGAPELPGAALGPQYVVTKTLRVDQDYTFRNDLTVRVRRVNENNVADDRDDSVELVVRTGTQSETYTMREYDSIFVDDYEIVAEDIQPSGVPGEGRAELQLRFIPPPGQAAAAAAPEVRAVTGAAQAAAAPAPLDIQSFGDLNALIIRYRDPADLKKIEDLLELLDKPVPQVEIETKMVEVNESRAKEFSSDWTINNLTERSIDLGSSILNTRFAQDLDEFVGEFEPGVEDAGSANLLKNVTIINLVTGGASPLNWQLRMLEAEGIINVVNGPRITIKDGEQGNFTITRYGGANIFNQYGTAGTAGNVGTVGGINPNLTTNQTGTTLGTTGYGRGGLGAQVDLSLQPDVTSENSIQVTVNTLILRDDTVNLGSLSRLANPGPFGPDLLAVANTYTMDTLQKDIQTVATVKSGGTIVLGGWTGERSQELTSGVPVFRNIPYLGKLFFSRNKATMERTTILIFLTVRIIPIE